MDTITTTTPKKKRPSKGQAKHNRRVKQEARKNAVPGVEVKKKKSATQAPK